LVCGLFLIDTRPEAMFKSSYLPDAINIRGSGQSESWLGTLLAPASKFYLIAGDEQSLDKVIKKAVLNN
jgi:hypothetical protein